MIHFLHYRDDPSSLSRRLFESAAHEVETHAKADQARLRQLSGVSRGHLAASQPLLITDGAKWRSPAPRFELPPSDRATSSSEDIRPSNSFASNSSREKLAVRHNSRELVSKLDPKEAPVSENLLSRSSHLGKILALYVAFFQTCVLTMSSFALSRWLYFSLCSLYALRMVVISFILFVISFFVLSIYHFWRPTDSVAGLLFFLRLASLCVTSRQKAYMYFYRYRYRYKYRRSDRYSESDNLP
eukprot:jgi/Mesen1/8146/ME000438S07256